MKRVTTWYRVVPDDYGGHYEYNHLADGWQDATTPIAINEIQAKAWAGKRWRKRHAYIENGVVTEI
jgi:hypothetical protein